MSSSMNVILKADVSKLGVVGDVVRVKGGYARNFLIPQGKALLADSRNVKVVEHAKFLAQHAVEKVRKAAEEVSDKLKEVSLSITLKVGEDDKVFGSVTSIDIENALKAEGFEMDRRKIQLEKPIKELGDFEIPVKLHKDVTVNVKLQVIKE